LRVIGRGIEELKVLVEKCRSLKGFPIIRTKFFGKELGKKVIFVCIGTEYGGIVEDVSPISLDKLKELLAQEKKNSDEKEKEQQKN